MTSSPSVISNEKRHERQNEVEYLPHHAVTREGVMLKKSIDAKAGVTWEERVLLLTHDRLLIAKVRSNLLVSTDKTIIMTDY